MAIEDDLIRDEGVKESAYQDHLGFWTIGVGRLIDARKGGRLSPDEIRYLLRNDIADCFRDIQSELWFLACDTPGRRDALLNMRFQLGAQGIRQFRTSLGYIQNRQWALAGVNLRKSLWYKQTPVRAERVIRMIENG